MVEPPWIRDPVTSFHPARTIASGSTPLFLKNVRSSAETIASRITSGMSPPGTSSRWYGDRTVANTLPVESSSNAVFGGAGAVKSTGADSRPAVNAPRPEMIATSTQRTIRCRRCRRARRRRAGDPGRAPGRPGGRPGGTTVRRAIAGDVAGPVGRRSPVLPFATTAAYGTWLRERTHEPRPGLDAGRQKTSKEFLRPRAPDARVTVRLPRVNPRGGSADVAKGDSPRRRGSSWSAIGVLMPTPSWGSAERARLRAHRKVSS